MCGCRSGASRWHMGKTTGSFLQPFPAPRCPTMGVTIPSSVSKSVPTPETHGWRKRAGNEGDGTWAGDEGDEQRAQSRAEEPSVSITGLCLQGYGLIPLHRFCVDLGNQGQQEPCWDSLVRQPAAMGRGGARTADGCLGGFLPCYLQIYHRGRAGGSGCYGGETAEYSKTSPDEPSLFCTQISKHRPNTLYHEQLPQCNASLPPPPRPPICFNTPTIISQLSRHPSCNLSWGSPRFLNYRTRSWDKFTLEIRIKGIAL